MRAAIRSVLFSAIQGIDLDFVRGRYASNSGYRSDFLGLPGATYTRAGAATAETAAGAIINFAANVPRITDRGVLIEEARTNLLLRSAEFDNAAWTKGGATISAGSTAAPDGSTTADTLTEDTSTGDHRTFQAASVANATVHTFSIFVKPNGRTLVTLTLAGVGDATFDVQNGVVTSTTLGSASITSAGSGWYRCAVTFTSATTSYNTQIRLVSTGTTTSYTGNGTSGVFLWGAQLEAGATPSSYIPTTGAAATRAADACSSPFSIPANQDFVVFMEVSLSGASPVTQRIFEIDAGSGPNRIIIYRTSAGIFAGDIYVASVFTSAGTFSKTGARTLKVAVRRVGSSYQIFADGVGVAAVTVASMPTLTTMFYGQGRSAATPLNDYLRTCALILGTLSDAQLVALTTL